MKKRILAMFMVTVLAAAALTGCSGSGSGKGASQEEISESETAAAGEKESSDTSESAGAAGKKFAVFIAQNSNEITMGIGEGAKSYGESIGAKVEVFDAQYNQDTQVSQMETCITQGYDALIVEPVSAEGIAPVAKTAKESGIPVITVMQDSSDTTNIDAHVGADHTEASVMEMEAICKALNGKGKIAVLDGTMGTTGQIQITEGFEKALADYPDIQIVEEQSANFLIDEAMEITETWLQKRSDIDAIAAQSDAMAMGAAKACKDAGVELLIGGRDCTSDMRTALKEGTTYCTVHQGSPEMGEKAVEFAVTLLDGGEVPEVYYTTNTLVTAENVEDFE